MHQKTSSFLDGAITITGIHQEVIGFKYTIIVILLRAFQICNDFFKLSAVHQGLTPHSGGVVWSLRIGAKEFQTATGSCRSTLEGHPDWVIALAFLLKGQLVVSASDDSTI